ncbi:IclR family transcriptional regulator [Oceanibium sediminis]|uniref:IclR family transcriptional regulator n=1 Tax=Oceanibium sediminis TaxID=2026339 RepID=UPI00130070CA|nr:IclR family transcriptional regulator [Oceanibium sediminis]
MATSRVKASDMALTIIEKIAFSDVALNQKEIAEAVGIVKSAAHKHLNTLEDTGWIMRDLATGRYQLGTKAWIVGQQAKAIQDLAEVGREPMRAARNETGLAVVLSLVNKNGLRVISALHGTHAIEIGVREGSELVLHASAQGQVALAFGGPALTEKAFKGDMAALTPKTLRDPDLVRARVEEVRTKGYACAPEETLLGVNVVAAPIFDHTRSLIGTAALIGSIQHLPDPPGAEHVDAVVTLARSISQARGYRPERVEFCPPP